MSNQIIRSYHDSDAKRAGNDMAPDGVIFGRPAVNQPKSVPGDVVQYLMDSHVSQDVLRAVSTALARR
jgi:hypothetical protein